MAKIHTPSGRIDAEERAIGHIESALSILEWRTPQNNRYSLPIQDNPLPVKGHSVTMFLGVFIEFVVFQTALMR